MHLLWLGAQLLGAMSLKNSHGLVHLALQQSGIVDHVLNLGHVHLQQHASDLASIFNVDAAHEWVQIFA